MNQKNKEIYFVTATGTNVGKTYASGNFLKKFAQEGKKVGYYKPIETGVVTTPSDGSLMLALAQKLNPEFVASIDDVVPYQFALPAAPFVAKGERIIDKEYILREANHLFTMCDTLIVEGAGGLMVPIEKDFFMVDLIELLKPTETYLITPAYLGCINETLQSLEILKNRNICHSWYINRKADDEAFETISLPFYKAYFDTLRFL